MAMATELVEHLKVVLRQKGVTYVAVATHLGLSESSVKRLFRDRDMTLTRLESICALVDIDISELADRTDEHRRNVKELTAEQEELLVSDEQLFLLAAHLIYGWSVEQILDHYTLDKHETQRHLTTLDKLRIIELLPENRVRILLSSDFEWIKGGPIQTFFENTVQGNFFNSDFSGDGELRLVVNGWMSVQNVNAFHESMRRLAREFDQHKQFDKHAPADQRKGTTMVLAIRPWALEIFEKYKQMSV